MRTLLVSLILLLPAAAAADVVEPEPASCPAGSTPSTAHSGPYCRPLDECTSDASCGASDVCSPIRQCIETRGCGGLRPPDAEPCTLEHVVGPCAGDGTCDVGECRTRSLCSDELDTGTDDGGCGCRVGAGESGAGLSLALIALGLLLWRRR